MGLVLVVLGFPATKVRYGRRAEDTVAKRKPRPAKTTTAPTRPKGAPPPRPKGAAQYAAWFASQGGKARAKSLTAD
jgi:hypothetical protein